MFAVPAVSTAVASDATRPRGSAAFFCVADGVAVELPLAEPRPAMAGALETRPESGVPSDGSGTGRLSPGLGVGDAAAPLADGGLDEGVGDGELGMQMMPRMQPWPANGAAIARCAPVTPTRAAARKAGSAAIASSRLTKPPPTRCPRRGQGSPPQPRR